MVPKRCGSVFTHAPEGVVDTRTRDSASRGRQAASDSVTSSPASQNSGEGRSMRERTLLMSVSSSVTRTMRCAASVIASIESRVRSSAPDNFNR